MRSLANVRILEVECAWVLHEALLVSALFYGMKGDRITEYTS